MIVYRYPGGGQTDGSQSTAFKYYSSKDVSLLPRNERKKYAY